LCEIALNGMVKATYQGLEFYVVPNSSNKNLESALSCLSNQKASASGKFDLEGKITAKAKPESPARYYSGELDFSADHGRIYRFGILAKILAILNVTEIYRGQIPDLVGEGFAYNSMNIKANFKGKKLVMEECSLDGTSMGLACEGDIDLADNTIDLVVLVAPFKTVDRIVKKIPLISSVLGGKLISIPFRAKGKLENPTVIPLSPTAVGSGVLGVLERTLKLPIKIIQPILPDEKKEAEDNQKP
ncbi:MAG: AsmA-like C-terminal domain-containing protein, partial [Desulfobacterales bacterium]